MKPENRILHFLKYNNTVPIVLGIFFFSTTATMAASPAVRSAVYTAQRQVVSTDNSFILRVDLENYDFPIQILDVREDGEYYYMGYSISTIDIVDHVWRESSRKDTLRVSKALLGEGDLEEFAESEFAQIRAREQKRLAETQAFEKRLGSSQKVIATVYSGLVGDLLTPDEERIPQYAGKIDKNDPLRVRNPQPLVTWDANAKVQMPKPPTDEPPEEDEDTENPGGGGEDSPPTDACPDSEGIQEDTSECPVEPEEPPMQDPEPEPEPEPVSDPTPEPAPEPAPEPGT